MHLRLSSDCSVHVPNVPSARAFYVELLGCAVFGSSADCAVMLSDGLQLHLIADSDPSAHGFTPTIEAESEKAALDQLVDCGYTPMSSGPASGGATYLRDPRGLMVALVRKR